MGNEGDVHLISTKNAAEAQRATTPQALQRSSDEEEQKTTPPMPPKKIEEGADTAASSVQRGSGLSTEEPAPPKEEAQTGPKRTSADAAAQLGGGAKRTSQLGALAQQTRKKRKSQLADLSAAAKEQPVKLNTLEKSKVDWDIYKGAASSQGGTDIMSEAERDELDAQTRGGGSGLANVQGYLHRKEFLDRVHSRLDSHEYDAHHGV